MIHINENDYHLQNKTSNKERGNRMPLFKAKPGYTGHIKAVSGNEKIRKFLFTLGCSEGEEITLISILANNYIISVKESRYAIDGKMAKAIEIA